MPKSLAHTKWVCKYHIIFTPKYRRKIIYNQLRKDICQILKDYRKIQGHWIIEMSEMIATANAKSIEEIKSFLSRAKETYKVPYETHPADRSAPS